MISVDTKKKELVGEYKNGGREWRPAGEPEKVKVHDFIDRQLGKAVGCHAIWHTFAKLFVRLRMGDEPGPDLLAMDESSANPACRSGWR